MRNHIEVHGYLGKKPELKTFTHNGKPGQYTKFSVACGRDFGDETDWFNVKIFGNRAETLEKFFDKGSQILVWGRMQSNKSEKDGHIYWEILAEGFDFCDSKNSPRGKNNPAAQTQPPQDLPDSFEEAEEDIPF